MAAPNASCRSVAALDGDPVQDVAEHQLGLPVVLGRHHVPVLVAGAGRALLEHPPQLGLGRRQVAAEHVHAGQGLPAAEHVHVLQDGGRPLHVAGHDEDVGELLLDLHVVRGPLDGLFEHDPALVRLADPLEHPPETGEVDRVVVDVGELLALDVQRRSAAPGRPG